MRDSIQLDQYVLQPLVKGSNSQISILTLDPDSPPFQNWNAQQSYFDDSLDDLKNEMDLFTIDSGDHYKNNFNFNCSAINTTAGSQTNGQSTNNYSKNRANNQTNNMNNNKNFQSSQSFNPLLLLNSKSDIYPSKSNSIHAESNNIQNSPINQFNYVNTNTFNMQQNTNNNLFFLPQPQLSEYEFQKIKQDIYEKNNKIKNAQTYPIKNQLPQFQKSNSAAFTPAQQIQYQTPTSQKIQPISQQHQQNIYFQQQNQQLFFFQQDESFFSLPSSQNYPLPQMSQNNSQVLMSPQLIPNLNLQSPQLGSQQSQKSGQDFNQKNEEQQKQQYPIIQNQSIYHVLQGNSFQMEPQNKQFIPNFYTAQQNANIQNQQYIQLQQQQQNQLNYQQKVQQFRPNNQQQYLQTPNQFSDNNYNNNPISNNNPITNNNNTSNNNLNTSLSSNSNTINNNINQNIDMTSSHKNPNQNNNAFSPFSVPIDAFILQQIENQIDDLSLPPLQINTSITYSHNTQNLQQEDKQLQQSVQDQQRQKKISFQDQKQQQPELNLQKRNSCQLNKGQKKLSLKKQISKRESVDKSLILSTSTQSRQNKKCIEKHCSGAGYQHYQPSSPINNSINPHRTLIIKQIIHHEQSQHDKNCFNLYNEYSIQSNLDHTNILKPIQMQLVKDVQDHPHTKGGCYIIYPKAQSDMYDYCLSTQSPFVDIEEIRKMMKQISSALLYIHEVKNIVHSDIKPENIFKLAKDHFVLADFGLAHHLINENNSKCQIKSENIHPQISNSNISSSSIQQNSTIQSKYPNKSILSDQNEDNYLSLISDNDQHKYLQVKSNNSNNCDSYKISNSDNTIAKNTFDNQYETSEGQTLDCTSQEQIQQTLDSQSQSSSSSSLSNLSKNSQDNKLKSCFHCYPQNLPDYVYANINSRQKSRQEESQDDILINSNQFEDNAAEFCDEDSVFNKKIEEENKKQLQFIEQEDQNGEVAEQKENSEIDDDYDEELEEEDDDNKEIDSYSQENLQFMNLCDQFSFKTRQSDYFSPEIIRYQTYVQNGVSMKELSKNGIDQIDEKKADIFALGMTLFVCLFKNYPYSIKCSVEDSLYKYIGQAEKKVREQFWSKFVMSLEHYANQYDDSRVHELKDLIEKMLHPNPAQRISIKEIISHPWLSASQ